jgi:hypothetical protein
MHDHWTHAEAGMLEQAKTFEDLADIAIIILARMKKHGKPIIQICGPMSTGGFGNLADNMQLFQYALDVATDMGLTVFNQLPFQDAMIRISGWEPRKPYCRPILEVFYRRIFESGFISQTLFMPDWQSSYGARWERELVTKLGIIIEEYPVEWLVSARITNKVV